jgi:hypothetical protein
VAIPDGSVQVHPGAGEAEMHVANLPIEDYFNLPNALRDGPEVDATVSFDVVWSGPVTRRVSVTNGTNGDQFAGQFEEDQATVTWSGSNELGFSFTANAGDLSTSAPHRGFAEVGHEENGIFFPGAEPVLASANPQRPVRQVLTPQQLQPVLRDAVAAWRAAGASPAQLAAMNQAPVHIAALPSRFLGEEAGGQVWVSPNADGWGWSVSTTTARGRMDLLSVLTHELGHVLGLADSTNGHDVMGEALPPGVRRLPTANDLGSPTHAASSDALLVRSLESAGVPAPGGVLVQPASGSLAATATVASAGSGQVVQLVPAPAVVTVGPAPQRVRDWVFADPDGGGLASALGIATVPAWPL